MMNPVQYIFLNKGLQMSTGKAAAQAAHASQMGLLVMVDCDHGRNPYDLAIVNLWMRGGHYAKVVLEVPDEEALVRAAGYIAARGVPNFTIYDEGRTEVEPLSRTALGTAIVDKNSQHIRDTFSIFKLYKDPQPAPERPDPDRLVSPERHRLSQAVQARLQRYSQGKSW